MTMRFSIKREELKRSSSPKIVWEKRFDSNQCFDLEEIRSLMKYLVKESEIGGNYNG